MCIDVNTFENSNSKGKEKKTGHYQRDRRVSYIIFLHRMNYDDIRFMFSVMCTCVWDFEIILNLIVQNTNSYLEKSKVEEFRGVNHS